ncbi:hypothetical protein J3E74DRAFT_356199, partial [Bipolaris maydis]
MPGPSRQCRAQCDEVHCQCMQTGCTLPFRRLVRASQPSQIANAIVLLVLSLQTPGLQQRLGEKDTKRDATLVLYSSHSATPLLTCAGRATVTITTTHGPSITCNSPSTHTNTPTFLAPNKQSSRQTNSLSSYDMAIAFCYVHPIPLHVEPTYVQRPSRLVSFSH